MHIQDLAGHLEGAVRVHLLAGRDAGEGDAPAGRVGAHRFREGPEREAVRDGALLHIIM